MELEQEHNLESISPSIKKNIFILTLDKVYEIMGNLSKKNRKNKQIIKELEKNATKILEAKLFDEYFDLLKNGYSPTKKQNKLWQEHINELIENTKYDVLNKYLEKGLKFTFMDNIYKYRKIFNSLLFILKEENEHFLNPNKAKITFIKNSVLYNYIRDEILKDEFQEKIKQDWLKKFKMYSSELNSFRGDIFDLFRSIDTGIDFYKDILIPLDNIPEILLKNIDYDNFMKLLSLWEKTKPNVTIVNFKEKSIYKRFNPQVVSKLSEPDYLDKVSEKIKEHFENAKNDKIKNMKENMKTVYIRENIELTIQQNFTQITSNLTMEQLPPEANQLINNIENLYNKLLDHLGEKIDATATRAIEHTIPSIVTKYLKFDIDDRTNLRNQKNQNPIEIMIESLQDIECVLKDKLNLINESNLQDLNAIKRYTNAMKN